MNIQTFQHRTEGDAAVFDGAVTFAAADPLFAGHFLDAPILPGVALVDAAVALASRTLGQPLRLSSVKSVKFAQPVAPDTPVAFAFKAEPSGAGWRVSGHWRTAAGKVSEMIFTAVVPDVRSGREGTEA
jgi:3-hydroxymyristoyl/3-hydroxydecanoyl-(acyl carrier protein) dehydratase